MEMPNDMEQRLFRRHCGREEKREGEIKKRSTDEARCLAEPADEKKVHSVVDKVCKGENLFKSSSGS